MRRSMLLVTTSALVCGVASAQTETIAALVSKDAQFSTLLAALKEAGLDKTLGEAGPYTVFAPTNAAFAKIPKATLDALLKNKAELTRVLTYHVVSGKVTAAEVMKMRSAKSLEGATLRVRVRGNTVEINNARVTRADIEASNGVIHEINTVLMPPKKRM